MNFVSALKVLFTALRGTRQHYKALTECFIGTLRAVNSDFNVAGNRVEREKECPGRLRSEDACEPQDATYHREDDQPEGDGENVMKAAPDVGKLQN